MRLLDRYLLRELLIPLGYCLCGFFILCIASDLFAGLGEFQRKKMLASDIAEYYLATTPDFIVLVLPIALLLALLYTLTNHARHNEITAIRAAGIGLWRLSLPYLAVGFLFSLLLFGLNEWLVPGTSSRAERILTRRMPEKNQPNKALLPASGLANLLAGRTWLAGDYNPKTSEMRNPLVISKLRDGSQVWLLAGSAVRSNGVWTFLDAREYTASTETNSLLVPSLQTNILSKPGFNETPEEIESEIHISKGMSLRAKNRAEIPLADLLHYIRLHPHPPASIKHWLYTKLHGRLAAPWTCLVVVLIALPFGAASGRRNVFVGAASSILICFIYFVLQQLGQALGTGGYVAAWLAAWFPNLAFGAVGLWMTARVR